MKLPSVVLTLVVLLESTRAQSDLLSSLPKCAVNCFEEAVASSACHPTDIPCLCGDSAFLAAAQRCEAASCTTKEILTSTNATLAACGVPEKSRSSTVMGIAASFGSLALILVITRIAGRLFVTKISLGWDDYLIIMAMTSAIGMNVCVILGATLGLGRNFWNIPFPDLFKTFKLLYIAEIFYMASEMFVQLSLLAFYLRVFPESRSFVRRGTWIIIPLVLCFGLANTMVIVFQCNPIRYFWNSWTGEATGTCLDINLFSFVRASIEIVVDIAILSLPLPSIWRLQMRWHDKLQIMVMFAIGFTITVVSIVRLQSLIQFAITSNPTYDDAPGIYWSDLESNMFIICASLPAVRSILTSAALGIFGRKKAESYPTGRAYYRHDNRGGTSSRSAEQYRLKTLEENQIVKSVDVDVFREERTGSDDDLVYPTKRLNIYGA